MMRFLKMLFTWWHHQTLSTLLHTRRRGKLMGVDGQGNCYYEDKHGASINGKTRRWVLYNAILKQPVFLRNGMAGCIIQSMKHRIRLLT